MAIKFRKQALKFLQKTNPEDVKKLQLPIKQLLMSIEDKGIIPFSFLDIKKLKGKWEGFYRLRVGTIRVIFTVNIDNSYLEIYTIGTRGDVYK